MAAPPSAIVLRPVKLPGSKFQAAKGEDEADGPAAPVDAGARTSAWLSSSRIPR